MDVLEEQQEELQLAENYDLINEEIEVEADEFTQRRELLDRTKIVKQTWSILELYQKIKSKQLILNPDYQRNEIWGDDKKTAFIESLYMGIMIPPIYVVELPGDDLLDETKYEVVDGKQRLTSIKKFISGELKLIEHSLEYYADIFGGKGFAEIKDLYYTETNEMLSSVLDIYVITSNSPEFTKYDIFARLNKGAEKLKPNEIRRAIYHSKVSSYITEYIENKLSKTVDIEERKQYTCIFSKNDIKRFEDYGRFYRSVAFYIRSDRKTCIVDGYNSRPREMINNVLQDFQKNKAVISNDDLRIILDTTIKILSYYHAKKDIGYIIDACIPFCIDYQEKLLDSLSSIVEDAEINESLKKSASTTANVNRRLKRVSEILID